MIIMEMTRARSNVGEFCNIFDKCITDFVQMKCSHKDLHGKG